VDHQPDLVCEIRNLTVDYLPTSGQRIRGVDDLNLCIHRGEVLGIIGESGSGKSTLAAAVVRLLPANAQYVRGSIQFEGNDLLNAGESAMRRIRGPGISMISQDPALTLNPVIKIGEQVSEVLRAHVELNRKQRKARVQELLREVGLENARRFFQAYPHQLSGGERQRVVIAQVMACRPALVIADEPTSKLDAPVQAQILLLLVELVRRNGTALILITHDPAVLEGFAQRIAVMYAGRIVEEGRVGDIFKSPLHPYTKALLRLSAPQNAGDRDRRFATIDGELPILSQSHSGCRFEPRCTESMPICSSRDPQESFPALFRRVSCFKYD